MYRRIIKCDYKFDSPWWDEVSENAKVQRYIIFTEALLKSIRESKDKIIEKIIVGFCTKIVARWAKEKANSESSITSSMGERNRKE